MKDAKNEAGCGMFIRDCEITTNALAWVVSFDIVQYTNMRS